MRAVLDAGAFVAIDKRDRRVGAMLRVLQQRRVPLVTSAAVVAQVWRDGAKQALLARVLSGVEVRALTPGDDKRTGELLALTRSTDVIDAHLVLGIEASDTVFTSDPDDIARLLEARAIDAAVVVV
ncbi:MAG TPA: hypothetical protein VJN18_20780 [Polyangiaceae bacterium]|nr:hypothetical protein [Polyangiaceae bacterium]